ncbi:MAG: M28 family peptidase [Muribaculaceae bacterium]|nr:M28 family peptidase [Muribaculaceae bacterium]
MNRKLLIAAALAACAFTACSGRGGAVPAAAESPARKAPAPGVEAFSPDTAFALVAAQVEMGPRTPGSPASERCAAWIGSRLRAAGADTVLLQRGTVRRFDGTELPACNILGRFAPDAPRRVLLLAHYDTRPWADMEPDHATRMQPIDGANDGASGVAVLLEIARCLGQHPAAVGVDLLLVDAEDSGYGELTAPPGSRDTGDSWCLGTQMWTSSAPYAGTASPAYAILLDMVGGRGARFHREQFSDMTAPRVVDRIWAEAAALGYADTFVNEPGGAVIDDHVYLRRAGIPAVDIIESLNPATGSFPPTWHTTQDNIDNIDPATLGRVGRTVLSLLYKEK